VSHAVVVQVRVDPDSDRQHRHSILNEFVIPETKALGGFQKATWMNDGTGTGTCIVVFDTEDNARSAVPQLTPASGPAVMNCAVCEVEIEI
jgi:hypothetical protein